MKFYEFHQNNSGGHFDKEMGHAIWVQANSADEANIIAEANGVYFDGCEAGLDCSCCGDRWYPVYERSGVDALRDDRVWAKAWGLDVNIIYYGQPMRATTDEDYRA